MHKRQIRQFGLFSNAYYITLRPHSFVCHVILAVFSFLRPTHKQLCFIMDSIYLTVTAQDLQKTSFHTSNAELVNSVSMTTNTIIIQWEPVVWCVHCPVLCGVQQTWRMISDKLSFTITTFASEVLNGVCVWGCSGPTVCGGAFMSRPGDYPPLVLPWPPSTPSSWSRIPTGGNSWNFPWNSPSGWCRSPWRRLSVALTHITLSVFPGRRRLFGLISPIQSTVPYPTEGWGVIVCLHQRPGHAHSAPCVRKRFFFSLLGTGLWGRQDTELPSSNL